MVIFHTELVENFITLIHSCLLWLLFPRTWGRSRQTVSWESRRRWQAGTAGRHWAAPPSSFRLVARKRRPTGGRWRVPALPGALWLGVWWRAAVLLSTPPSCRRCWPGLCQELERLLPRSPLQLEPVGGGRDVMLLGFRRLQMSESVSKCRAASSV